MLTLKNSIYSFLLIFIFANTSFATTKILEVTASETVSYQTTEATISFDIIGRGPDTEISYQDYAAKSLNIITYLRSESVEVTELQTKSFISRPVFNVKSKNREIVGFDTISSVSFKVPTELVAVYLNFLTKNKIEKINNIEFSIADDLLEQKKEKAVKLAIDKALIKADKVLAQLNLKRKAVVKIELDTSNVNYPRFNYQVKHGLADSQEPIIIPKNQDVSAKVSLQIAY